LVIGANMIGEIRAGGRCERAASFFCDAAFCDAASATLQS
jgi:hypothetical protein